MYMNTNTAENLAMDEHTPSTESSRLVNGENDGYWKCNKDKVFRILQPCLAELIGVALFVFIGILATQDVQSNDRVSAIAVAVAHGFMITVLVAAFGHISGGHMNPAVTLGVAIGGGIKPLLALLYVVFQLIGSIIGAGIARGALSFEVAGSNNSRFTDINAGATALSTGVPLWSGFIIEMMLTSILVFTVLLTAVDSQGRTTLAPLAIGFAVTVGILAGVNDSGASMNPARSFGPAIFGSSHLWKNHWIYWIGPIAGSGIAALTYRIFFASPDKRILFK